MFDPHRIRRSDRRYYTRKGQVLQASRVDVQPIIDQRLVPVYKKYLIANGLAFDAPQPSPPSPPEPIGISGISVNNVSFPFTLMTVYSTPTVQLRAVAGQGDLLVIVFYKDTGGNYFLQISRKDSGVFEQTINDNAECYFYYENRPNGINLGSLDSYVKGILDATGEKYVMSFKNNTLYIKNDVTFSVQ